MTDKSAVSKSTRKPAEDFNTDLHQSIRQLLLAARTQVRQTVNTAMVQTYWLIGQKIVEDEQGGHKRAAYGKQVLPELARRLGVAFLFKACPTTGSFT